MIPKEDVCCFTGHRRLTLSEGEISHRLIEVITMLTSKGVIYYGCGGALGFDTLAAEAVIKVRQTHPEVKLILVLPCKDQTKFWKPDEIWRYETIKRQADKVVYISESYTPTCMHDRNRHLVSGSGTCVAFLSKSSGGTYNTVNYAVSRGLRLFNIASNKYRDPVDIE